MSEINRIVEELRNIHDGDAWHGPSLKESLASLTAAQAAAKPIASAHSIWELVAHIAAWERVFRSRLEGHTVVEPEEGDFPQPNAVTEPAWQQTVAHLDEEHERLLATISSLAENRLEEIVAGKDYSIRHLLSGIIRHHVYHAGQITLLRKAE